MSAEYQMQTDNTSLFEQEGRNDKEMLVNQQFYPK